MYADQGRISGYTLGDLADEAVESAGKWSPEFDDANTLNDWVVYICMYATDAAKMGISPQESYQKLLKAMNLCGLAATRMRGDEGHGDVTARHYDDLP